MSYLTLHIKPCVVFCNMGKKHTALDCLGSFANFYCQVHVYKVDSKEETKKVPLHISGKTLWKKVQHCLFSSGAYMYMKNLHVNYLTFQVFEIIQSEFVRFVRNSSTVNEQRTVRVSGSLPLLINNLACSWHFTNILRVIYYTKVK